MKTIADEWSSFDRMVIAPQAPAIQRREMKNAFYAGAYAMFGCFQDKTIDDLSEEACAQVVASLDDEVRRYARGFMLERGVPQEEIDSIIPLQPEEAHA